MVDGRRWMKWRAMMIAALAMCAGAALWVPGCGSGGESPSSTGGTNDREQRPKIQTIELGGRSFALEVAADEAAITQGLSDRKSIAADGGMLFVFDEPRYAQFVMRRCYVPIDLIFVDRKGYIDSLHRMEVIRPIEGPAWHNPSSGYNSAGRVQYAIELKGGTLDELGLSRGDKIDLPTKALQSLVR